MKLLEHTETLRAGRSIESFMGIKCDQSAEGQSGPEDLGGDAEDIHDDTLRKVFRIDGIG